MKTKDSKLSIRVFLGSVGSKRNPDIRPLTIRVIYRRQKKEYVLGWKVHISNFSEEKQRVLFSKTGNLKRKDVRDINRTIEQQRTELIHSFNWLKKQCSEFNVQMVIGDLQKKRSLNNVEAFYTAVITKLLLEKRYGTAGQYKSGLSSLSHFIRTKGIAKLLFKDIDETFISDYIHYLRKRNITENTVMMYLKTFRALYNKARKEGVNLGPQMPFRDIRVRRQETLKRALCVRDIQKIAHCNLSHNLPMQQARDLFMFSFYTRGMSFVDIIHLRHCSIMNNTIYYERHKTGQLLQIKIEKPLRDIIEKYKQVESPYIFPILTNTSGVNRPLYTNYRYALASANRFLKRLGKELSITLPLTTYVARHSWATIAKQEGVSIAGISESLGHSSERTTQIYLRSFGDEVIEQINKHVVNCISKNITKGSQVI